MVQETITKSSAKSKPAKISYDEFLKRHTSGEHLEWVNGKVVPMSPVTNEHSELGAFLIMIMRLFVATLDLGTIRYEPYNMKTGYGLPGRSPDIFFVAKANLARLHDLYLDGPADLAVEIVSAGSRRMDRVTKFAEYEQGGVREYWILDPKRTERDFYVRDNNGKFQPVVIGADGIYRSTVLNGFWIKVDWLWQTPLPEPIDVLKAWGLI